MRGRTFRHQLNCLRQGFSVCIKQIYRDENIGSCRGLHPSAAYIYYPYKKEIKCCDLLAFDFSLS